MLRFPNDLSKRRPARRGAVGLLAAVALATSAVAGPVDPSHRFESIGVAPSEIAVSVAHPDVGRLLVLTRTGEIRLCAGDGLIDELLGTVPTDAACASGGVLDAAWNPAAPGSELYVSHVSDATSRLTVSRVRIAFQRLVGIDVIHEVALGPACDQRGGALAFDDTGRLLIGVGDHGDTVAASDPTSPAGKLLRLEPDGSVPAVNASGTARFASGFRDPTRIAVDSPAGAVYLLDLGPGDDDEINRIAEGDDYGWPTGAGALGTPGLTDPIHAWSPATVPVGLEVYQGDDLTSGHLVAAFGDGRLVELQDPLTGVSGEVELYVPVGAEPASFRDVTLGTDGHVYLPTPTRSLHRFLRGVPPISEPSSQTSIVPLLVAKNGNQLSLSLERRPAATEIGLYVGTLGSAGPTHPTMTDLFFPVDGNVTDAATRHDIDVSEITTRGGQAAYFVASARDSLEESGTGTNSNGSERPGGHHVTPCTSDCTGPVGRFEGDCAPTFTLAEGVQGVGNRIGPAEFFQDYACMVILIHLGAEW